jgi:transposase-like protein
MGRPKYPIKPDVNTLKKLYMEQLKSIREVARELSLHPDTVHYWLKKYGIPTRTMAKRSKLLKISTSELKEGVKEKGIRGYAKELGVNASTLSRFLKSETE